MLANIKSNIDAYLANEPRSAELLMHRIGRMNGMGYQRY
jgi:hypothetical protein